MQDFAQWLCFVTITICICFSYDTQTCTAYNTKSNLVSTELKM